MSQRTTLRAGLLVLMLILAGGCAAQAHAQATIHLDEDITIDKDTVWDEDVTVDHRWVTITDGATLTIKPGVTVTFTGGYASPVLPSGIVVYGGALVAEGTEARPITFQRSGEDDYFTIFIDHNPDSDAAVRASFLRHVRIVGGGIGPWENSDPPVLIGFFMPVAHAAESLEGRSPAVHVYGGSLTIENSVIENSRHTGIQVEGGGLRVVNSNFIDNERDIAARSDTYVTVNHCWFGDKEVDGVTTINDREEALIVDPIVVVPGILGSALVDGEWVMDPILHVYDDLISSLMLNGYTREYVEPFPYDWHASNRVTAGLLSDKIRDVREQTMMSRVDVVAHSMGGLVTRAYIQGDAYRDDIDQFLTLGTPHKGAPKAYLMWEAGESPKDLTDRVLKLHLRNEAKHNGYDSLKDYTHEKVPSASELLPIYDYIKDAESDDLRRYPDGYPRNSLLEELAGPSLSRLSRVRFTNIVGTVPEHTTITGYTVDDGDGWDHGKPVGFGGKNASGVTMGSGDETVPTESARDISAQEIIEVSAKHTGIPDAAQCTIMHQLGDMDPSDCDDLSVINVVNLFMLNVFSPVDVMVTAPDGKRVGTDPATGRSVNEIPGAYYTGNDTKSEFLTIPNPKDGDYVVTTVGTGNGAYRIETSVIADKGEGTAAEDVTTKTGTATDGQQESFTVTVADKGTAISRQGEDDGTADTSADGAVAAAVSGNDDDDDNDKDDNGNHHTKKKSLLATVLGDSTEAADVATTDSGVQSVTDDKSVIATVTDAVKDLLPRVAGVSDEHAGEPASAQPLWWRIVSAVLWTLAVVVALVGLAAYVAARWRRRVAGQDVSASGAAADASRPMPRVVAPPVDTQQGDTQPHLPDDAIL